MSPSVCVGRRSLVEERDKGVETAGKSMPAEGKFDEKARGRLAKPGVMEESL